MTHTPMMKTVPRTWSQRLFSWPWRPWVATALMRDWKAEFAHPSPAMTRYLRSPMAGPFVKAEPLKDPRHAFPQRSPMRMPSTNVAERPGHDTPLNSAASDATDNVLRFLRSEPTAAEATPSMYRDGFASGGGGEFTGGGTSGSYEAPSSSDSNSASSSDGGSSSSSSSLSD